jgi:nicotinamidase-related amidase
MLTRCLHRSANGRRAWSPRSSGHANERFPIVYANDNFGRWDGNAPRLVAQALAGRGGDVLGSIAPRACDRFVVKPRYSAFDQTALELILRQSRIERLLIAGAATERCVAQTAIDGREIGFKITIVTDACATADARLERLSLEYLEKVVGAQLDRAAPPDVLKQDDAP